MFKRSRSSQTLSFYSGQSVEWMVMAMERHMGSCRNVSQLVSSRGLCEFDDVIHNCLGALIGVVVTMLIRKLSRLGETK